MAVHCRRLLSFTLLPVVVVVVLVMMMVQCQCVHRLASSNERQHPFSSVHLVIHSCLCRLHSLCLSLVSLLLHWLYSVYTDTDKQGEKQK